jgi:hypothetical protein
MVSSPGGGAGPDGHRYPRNAGPCGDRCSAARNLHDPNRHDRRDRSSPDGCREPCAPGWQPDRTDDRTTGGRSRKTAGAPQGGSAQRSARRGSLGRTGLRDRARLRDGRRCSTVSRAGASAGGRHRPRRIRARVQCSVTATFSPNVSAGLSSPPPRHQHAALQDPAVIRRIFAHVRTAPQGRALAPPHPSPAPPRRDPIRSRARQTPSLLCWASRHSC